MSNQIHVIWQVQPDFQPKDIQLSFVKYTARMIIKDLRNNHQKVLEIFKVKASDRKYQIWERNLLSVSLWLQPVFKQKLYYIHSNPVVAGICKFPQESERINEEVYKYLSASFYLKVDCNLFLSTHYHT